MLRRLSQGLLLAAPLKAIALPGDPRGLAVPVAPQLVRRRGLPPKVDSSHSAELAVFSSIEQLVSVHTARRRGG